MFEDFDCNCSDYDYVVGAVRYLGYTEIFKCGFKEISEIESYVFFHDDSSYDDNICRCVDNENDVLRVYVDVGFLIPAANGVMRGENEDYQVDLDAFDDMIDVEIETNDVLGDSSGAEIELDDNDSSVATDASLYSDEDSEAIEKNKSTMISYAKNCDHKTLKFEIGMRFRDYKECRDAVKLWAILNGYNIKWMKSGGHKLQARCEDNCSWRLYASTLTKELTFIIKTYHEKHTCVRATRNIQENSQWIADMFMPKLKSNQNYRAIDIKNDCRLTYGITVTKSLYYKAKKTAEDQHRGTYEEHYSKGDLTEAWWVLRMLLEEGKCDRWDGVTYVNVFGVCGHIRDLILGRQVHGRPLKIGLHHDLSVRSATIDMYEKYGEVSSMRKVFDGLKAKNEVTWSATLTAYS
ncbi:hypothetical protein C2S51_001274 [Perilla frutescens var. frutescens]|nr:hypothetical protein C2S51_001274 [Perilla frutescens var. frutescens]